MSYRLIDGIKVWGDAQANAVEQIKECAAHGRVADVALMADHHHGFSQPIGGVVAYRGQVSPSGVGFDIACGNRATRTNLHIDDIAHDLPRIADEIQRRVAFGVGRTNATPVDHELFDDSTWHDVPYLRGLKDPARGQLGTVGGGNHYVDVFVEEATGDVWVGVHFGSRGFGHKVASGFTALAKGVGWQDRPPHEKNGPTPALIDADSDTGRMYVAAMQLAGQYAYAGRDYVVGQVLDILGAEDELTVHNHHNYAWEEEHDGERLQVVRKGATPAFPGQLGFIGGSMCDISVIVRGVDSQEARAALNSTVHGAGRVMSRTAAKGKTNRRTGQVLAQGRVTPEMMRRAVADYGIHLRGGDLDESPFVYRSLQAVLDAHADSIEVLNVLRPVVVVMAGAKQYDPYKD